MEHDYTLDLKDMCCQGPILLMTKEFKKMDSGKVVLVTSDRDSMQNDVPAFCRMQNHEVLQQDMVDGRYYFWVKLH
jgi:TusA-related sulfurtransferase